MNGLSKKLTEQEYKDLSSFIWKIPEEYAERQKYIVCELIIEGAEERCYVSDIQR